MAKWEELHKKEQMLIEKEDTLIQETRQIQQLKESYDDHFRGAQRFMQELNYTFHKNNNPHYYESMRDEFSNHSRKVMGNLEESEHELKSQKSKIQQSIEDVGYEKRKAMTEEKEKKNEY